MGKTEKNLQEAFAGESQANRKYLAFAGKAEKEGFVQAAKLFRAAAAAETIHAHAHLRAMNGVKTTAENLKEAIAGETHEFTNMYPQMITDAESEGHKAALRSFQYANAVEKVHAALYRKALETLEEKAATYDYYICTVCGHTHEKEAPDKCPVCGANANAFFKSE
ncbi:MAG: rubrerythrin family protein [Deltaproteobacteria bacterium]|nr:rubrerythrin family protein [Deltaproteobacteria bacterium]